MKETCEGKLRTIKGDKPKTLEKRIQRLEDIESIKETIHYYTYCADNGDYNGMIACYTDDCTSSYFFEESSAGRIPVTFNREETYQFLKERLIQVVSATHYISNEQIFFENNDTAYMYMYMYSWQRFIDYPAHADLQRYGRYELMFAREEDGEWRINTLQLLAAGEYNGTRIAEQKGRPWPPCPLK